MASRPARTRCCSPTCCGKQWGFDGHVVSDCGAIYDIWANHKFAATPEEAAAAAVKAGDDLCCGTDYNSLARAVKKGLISEKEIDTAVGRVLEARFRLGLFDPPDKVPFAQIPIRAKRHAGTRGAGAESGARIHRAAEK